MDGFERLKEQVKDKKEPALLRIVDYLLTREDIKDKYLNEEKNVDEMYKYIYKRARKQATNNVAVVDDNIVFLWAIEYFLKSNEELQIKKEENKVAPVVKSNKKDQNKVQKEDTNKEEVKKENEQISMF